MSSPFQQQFSAKSPLNQDPDAPGTPNTDGYEPPVIREELDPKGKKLFDDLRIENARLLKSGMTQNQINKMRLERHKKKKEQDK
jgi:hypothetical protein